MTEIRLADVFAINRQGFNLRRGVSVLLVMLLPLIVLGALGEEKYFVGVALGALFTGLCDPGGRYGYRAPRLACVTAAGALLTAFGYWLGSQAWGWVTLGAFAVTLAASLAVKYGKHRFTAALLLNVWFLIAVALPGGYAADHVHTGAWPQAAAWAIGSAVMIGWIGVMWLATGRSDRQQTGAELLPGDTTPVPLSRPVVLYCVIRAVAVAAAVAIAFGFGLDNADWMPVAALIAMQPSLQQSTVTALQRLAGAIIGAVVASVFLLAVDNKIALGVVIVIVGGLAGAIRAVGYTWYVAAVAATVLIAEGMPHPTDLAEEARRVAFTFAGVAIAVLVTYLATMLAKRRAAAARPQSSATAGASG
ncbi:FUSC family protein [Yinghuangia seranimata]|uniref:FUSC family protein n=1 Tax=Yinghuangia seranimata TaxID=408067 RepID=UPI00248B3AA3|nr:FUSC family protein [Yinghuangia seranimata]MDI2127726.1 FUSC family protein [Yinghuangia seranimata]